MPTIADQVAALEYDHSDALAKIDTLNATNAALTDALNAITVEKAALEAKVAELRTHSDGMLAMVENVASSALDMLNAAKRPLGAAAEAIPFAPKGSMPVIDSARLFVDGTAEVMANDSVAHTPAVAPDFAHGDSGDESDADQKHLQAIAARMMRRPKPAAIAPIAAIAEPEPVAPPIGEALSAIDAIKRRSLPFLTLMRRPAARNTDAAQDVGGLPMFLQRDTVFARSGSQPARM